jgi:hypothetical protein
MVLALAAAMPLSTRFGVSVATGHGERLNTANGWIVCLDARR